MQFVRINGVLLHYRVAGPEGAPCVVLANSLGTDARIWDEVIADLARDYQVISYDKRGHGLSDAPEGDYTLDDHVTDLAGLLKHLRVEKLFLAGVSVGGLIAQGFALQHPEMVTALVLCDTAAQIGDADSWNGRISLVREKGLEALADPVMERWFSPGFRSEQKDQLAGWRNLFLRTSPAGYAATCATLRDTDLRARIGSIFAPTLVVVGEQDGSTPVDLVRSCADAIPGARFEVIANAGHIPSIEQPGRLTDLMRAFFKETANG